MSTLWMENLERLVNVVEAKLAAADVITGNYSHDDYDGWLARRSACETALIKHFTHEEGARFGERGDLSSIRMAGIKSSSTQGVTAAIRNWRVAARSRLADGPSDPINLQGSGPSPIVPREG